MNGINYKFTKKEVESIARLLKLARESGDKEIIELSIIIATAFNRNGLGINDMYSQLH